MSSGVSEGQGFEEVLELRSFIPPTAVCNDNNNDDDVNNSGREKEEVFPGTLFTGLRRGCSSRVGAGRSGVQSAASR